MRLLSALALLLPLAPAAQAQAQDEPPAPPGLPLQAPAPLDIARLQRDLDALKASTRDGLAPADAQNAPLLRFKIEQVEQCLDVLSNRYKGRTLYSRVAIERIAPFILQRAQVVAKAQGAFVDPAPSILHERAYIADNDGSAQPYWIFVPRDYSADRKYGLAVFLHGYGPDVSKINPWLPDDTAVEAAHKAGLLLVLPHGRRNTDFVDAGEDDVLRVSQEVQKHYSIDPARVFLTGPSMGGYGTWAIGLHRPDKWAGLAPMAARTDFYLWFKLQRDQVPAWKRAAFDADDPLLLAENATGLPLFFQHGALDAIVNVEQSRRMAKALDALKIKSAYREIPFGDHYIYFYDGAYEAAFNWMGAQKPAPAQSPSQVRYTSVNARNDGAHWARITDRLDYSVPASIDAQVVSEARQVAGEIGFKYLLRATTKNVAALTLSPPSTLLPKGAQYSLEINDNPVEAKPAPDGTISWRDPAAPLKTEWPQSKSPTRSGPIKNAWRDPFLVVYGTQVLEGQKNLDESRARAWAAQWQDYSDGAPRIKSDKEVTADDRARFNLILFGSAQSNALIREAGDKLPLQWTPEGVRVGSGGQAKLLRHLAPDAKLDAPPDPRGPVNPANAVQAPGANPAASANAASAATGGGGAGRDIKQDALLVDVGANAVWWNYPPTAEPNRRELGLVFCYASPWSSERLVVVQSGPLWGAFLPFNHKWDLLPDYAIYTQNRDASDNTNQTLAAGFFGRNWELKP